LGFDKDFHISRLTDDEAHEYIYDFSEIEGKDLPEYLKRNIQIYKHFLKPKNTKTIKERLEQSQLQIQQIDTDIQKLQQLQQQRQQICAEIESWEYQRHVMQKGYHFTSDWFSVNIPNWKKYLSRFVNVPEINALEIGSWEGRSACWLLDNVLTHESARLTCIDTWQGSAENANFDKFLLLFLQERFDVNISLTGHPEKVIKKVNRSLEVLPSLSSNSYDLIYVNSFYNSFDVLWNAVLLWKLLKVGGIIIFDDYAWNKKNKMDVDHFIGGYSSQIKIIHKWCDVFIEKLS
jgi:predicted O-methyltransferase YrrM